MQFVFSLLLIITFITLCISWRCKRFGFDFLLLTVLIATFFFHLSFKFLSRYIDQSLHPISSIDLNLYIFYGPLLMLYYRSISNLPIFSKERFIYISIFLVAFIFNVVTTVELVVFKSQSVTSVLNKGIWILEFLVILICTRAIILLSYTVQVDSLLMRKKIIMAQLLAIVLLLPFLLEIFVFVFPSDNFLFPYEVYITPEAIWHVSVVVIYAAILFNLIYIATFLRGLSLSKNKESINVNYI